MTRNSFVGIVTDDTELSSAFDAGAIRLASGWKGEDTVRLGAESTRFIARRVSHLSTAQDAQGYCIVLGRPRIRNAEGHDALSAVALLERYRRRGAAVLDELAGGFAVVVQDSATGRTMVAVDRFGIYPLAYREVPGGVVVGRFADEVATVLPGGRELSAQSIFDYLYFHVVSGPGTVFASVRRLEAAQCLEIGNGVASLRRYWEPVYSSSGASFQDLKNEFLGLMERAVGREMAGDSVGAYLSGGTDSSSVAGWLARLSKERPACFSIGFAATGYDEMEYARLAARHFDVQHHEYYVTPADIVAGVPVVAAHYDQPFGNSSALPAFVCAEKARSASIRVLLAGDGGDEIFGGNTRYAKQKIFESYFLIPRAVRTGLVEPVFLGSPLGRMPIARKVASYVRQAKLGLPARMETYNLLKRLGASSMLTARFVDSVSEDAPASHQLAVFNACRDQSVLNRMLAYDLKFTLADADLPKVVHTAELAGCEARFPLLADELVDFANRLSVHDKVRGLRLRHFFKEASRGFLPDEILTKSKHGFGLPFGAWVVSDPALRNFARENVVALADRGVVRLEFVNEVMGIRLSEHAGYYGEAIWILMMLEQWLRAHAPDYRV